MKSLLSSTAFLIVNKRLSNVIGLKPSVLLADLISKEQYFHSRGECAGGWFYNTRENITKDTTLSRHEIDQSIKILKQRGILQTKLIGLPAVKHFKIFANKIADILQTDLLDIENTDCKEVATNNNNLIITKNEISILKQEFQEEVFSSDYTTEMCQSFFDYWTEPDKKGKMRFEKQKTWCTSRRLSYWNRTEKKMYPQKQSKISKNIDILNNLKNKINRL